LGNVSIVIVEHDLGRGTTKTALHGCQQNTLTHRKQKMKIRALPTKILATEMERGEQKSRGGIVLLDDDGKVEGVRARWMQVYVRGAEVTNEIQEGNWIYVDHGRWTRGMEIREGDDTITLWGIDPDSILLVSDEKPQIERVMKDTVSEFAPPGA